MTPPLFRRASRRLLPALLLFTIAVSCSLAGSTCASEEAVRVRFADSHVSRQEPAAATSTPAPATAPVHARASEGSTDCHCPDCQPATLPAHTPHLPHTHARAGCPQTIAPWARTSLNHRYSGCWVGGGAALFGEGRYLNEGTWGVDYTGHWLPHRVWLNWWHGAKQQGGTGHYKTDGPHIWKRIKESHE